MKWGALRTLGSSVKPLWRRDAWGSGPPKRAVAPRLPPLRPCVRSLYWILKTRVCVFPFCVLNTWQKIWNLVGAQFVFQERIKLWETAFYIHDTDEVSWAVGIIGTQRIKRFTQSHMVTKWRSERQTQLCRSVQRALLRTRKPWGLRGHGIYTTSLSLFCENKTFFKTREFFENSRLTA